MLLAPRAFTIGLFAFGTALACGAPTLAACGSTPRPESFDPPTEASAPLPTATVPAPPTPPFVLDAGADADAAKFEACASTAVEAKRDPLPVDIVWIVDNSASMAPAVAEVQAGLNAFAAFVGTKGLDYKMVMLSLRGDGPTTIGGQLLYPVCVPPPLGGVDCADGPNFRHASLNVLST
ncbi:MAG TPA: hypothetical protein PK141_11605, partial [Polyangiaceae bacterium]|nr:hypothetical protein [Polyangiaceae bacterium]